MQISNDGGFAGAVWQPYVSRRTWVIPEYWNYVLPWTVYVRFRDAAGNVSAAFHDDVILDRTPPVGTVTILESADLAAVQQGGDRVTVKLAASDNLSGVRSMRLSHEPRFVGTIWQDYATTTSWTTNGGARVYVQFRDRAGNVSPVYSAAVGPFLKVYLPALTR